jgi:hypothetical protein
MRTRVASGRRFSADVAAIATLGHHPLIICCGDAIAMLDAAGAALLRS